jgi:hypothetical protein
MNIVEPIFFQAKLQPGTPALCAQGIDVVSYERLLVQINNIAHRAQANGLSRGNVVALSIDQPLPHAVVILGLAASCCIKATSSKFLWRGLDSHSQSTRNGAVVSNH